MIYIFHEWYISQSGIPVVLYYFLIEVDEGVRGEQLVWGEIFCGIYGIYDNLWHLECMRWTCVIIEEFASSTRALHRLQECITSFHQKDVLCTWPWYEKLTDLSVSRARGEISVPD